MLENIVKPRKNKGVIMENDTHKKACDLFNDGWEHFLKCMNFGASAMDAKAIGWMNDISIAMRKIEKESE